jgi:TPR repeat protein
MTRQTPDDYHNQGMELYRKNNFNLAYGCFSLAVLVNSRYSPSLLSLGYLYQYGHGVDQDLLEARHYYERALNEGSLSAGRQLILMDNPQPTSAGVWQQLGRDYYRGLNGKTVNYTLACICFHEAVQLDNRHHPSLYRLGWLYQYGQGVVLDATQARQYYERALNAGNFSAGIQLVLMDNPQPTSSEAWQQLGEDYYKGRNGKAINYTLARICYKKTIQLNARDSHSLYSLGWIYQFGRGVSIDLIRARQYYEKAAAEGHVHARIQILKIDNSGFNSNQWFKLGKDYQNGHNGREKNITLAETCYKQAIQLNSGHINSLYFLGSLYHFCFAPPNHEKAQEYYLRAIASGSIYAGKSLKYLERDFVLSTLKTGGSINQTDSKNDTALHRAAKYKHLKNCARLIMMNARKDIDNAESKKPLDYLDEQQKDRITKLQASINIVLTQLKGNSPDIMMNRIFLHRASEMHKENMRLRLKEFYTKPEVAPLMDLAKLAVLGLHNHSKRQKFTDSNYDSDDDDKETLNPDRQYLQISIDPEKPHVDNIVHYGSDGSSGKNSHGLYQENMVFLGGRRDNPGEAGGTFIHELTHFVAQEVYQNNCNPYSASTDDEKNRDQFAAIATDLESKKGSLDPILQAV